MPPDTGNNSPMLTRKRRDGAPYGAVVLLASGNSSKRPRFFAFAYVLKKTFLIYAFA